VHLVTGEASRPAHDAAPHHLHEPFDGGSLHRPPERRRQHHLNRLPGPLRDPFDRMPIAQAMLENLHLVSIERAFDVYGVLRRW
jgi:hypothetical protein